MFSNISSSALPTENFYANLMEVINITSAFPGAHIYLSIYLCECPQLGSAGLKLFSQAENLWRNPQVPPLSKTRPGQCPPHTHSAPTVWYHSLIGTHAALYVRLFKSISHFVCVCMWLREREKKRGNEHP